MGGIDTAHKISLLTACAFGTRINFENVVTKGIQNVSLVDIKNAESMGYKIKLMALSSKSEDGITQEVEPCLVPKDSIFGKTSGVLKEFTAPFVGIYSTKELIEGFSE